jgi:ubiquinone biosynthesis protein COQ4
MTTVPVATDLPALAAPPPARPLAWRRAGRLLRELVAEPERTERVFELLDAVGGRGHEGSFQRFAATPTGRLLLRLGPSLVAALADRDALARLPDGSLRRAYLDFASARDFAADGLVEMGRGVGINDEVDPARRFYYERFTAMHDLWHVLTGYGTDEAGEAALLAFTLAQNPSRGIALLVAAAAWMLPWRDALSCQRHLARAWRRGRRAARLDAAPWEAWLAEPLAAVRERVALEPAARAHPRGILQGGRDSGLRWVAA